MSNITIMFALAPAIAPVIGGWLETLFGWRSVFAFLTLFTSALGLACWRSLPETLPVARRQSLRPGYLARTYWKVLTHPPFLLACAALSFNFGGFFIYVLSAPVFVMQHLGASETGFLWLFGPAMGGLMGGAWISGRLAGKVSPGRTIAYGYLLMGCAVLLNFSLAALFGQGLPWSVAHLFIYTLGMSLAMPCLTLFALDPFPEQRGLAASCQTFLQSCFNALAAGLIAPALWPPPGAWAGAWPCFSPSAPWLAWATAGTSNGGAFLPEGLSCPPPWPTLKLSFPTFAMKLPAWIAHAPPLPCRPWPPWSSRPATE